MGSSGTNQQQAVVGQQKAQKGWLSRWTRKQWSRHWFVLKNGSLTYYRGPAAELCSFLDGVLDLSLIKHIEVPQQEEQVLLGHHHQHHNHHHHQHQQHHHHHLNFNQISPAAINFVCPQQQHQTQQQPGQQEHQQHFNFSLKMWNGECHLLSASSLSERQLWLAAINSCNNYDDETASSDSSSSSQSSNISTKSADIGSSHHPNCLAVSGPLQQGGLGAAVEASLAYQQQQQQEKEAEISLEQLALKLKSVVRRRRDADGPEPEEAPQKTLVARQKSTFTSSQKSPVATQTSQQPLAIRAEKAEKLASQLEAGAAGLGEQAHKRRLVCPQSPSTSPASPMEIAKPEAEPKLEASTRRLEVDESVGGDHESETPSSAGASRSSSPAEPGRSSSGDLQTPDKLAAEDEPRKSPEVAELRQKKRVTFDLSNQNIDSTSCSSSEEDADDKDDSEATDESEAGSLSSVSTSASETEEEEEVDEDDEEDDEDEDEESEEAKPKSKPPSRPIIPRAPTTNEKPAEAAIADKSQRRAGDDGQHFLLDYAGIKRIEMRRRLELREQLKYSKQWSNNDDEDSTCELVRRMIERRKLRLQKRDGAEAGRKSFECDKENETLSPTGGALSPTVMETAQDEPSTSSNESENVLRSKPDEDVQAKQIELELRLKSAEVNAELLEKRLSDSYQSYSQLETSYKQLQLELVECRELSAKNMAATQAKIDELTNELRVSERKLLEAKEKLIQHEEYLARWQLLTNTSANNGSVRHEPEEPRDRLGAAQTSHSPRRKGDNWLGRNYSNSMLTSTSSGNKLLMNLAQSLAGHQPAASGANQVIHQMKHSLTINQQQLSLKLLSQSKQIQRKLNELELKVDKIQNTSASGHLAGIGQQQQQQQMMSAGSSAVE